MTWTIGAVTLPIDPFQIIFGGKKTVKKADIYNHYPFLLPIGPDVTEYKIKFWVFVSGQTRKQLYDTYVAPLDAYRQSIATVTITEPTFFPTGTTCLITELKADVRGVTAFVCDMTIWVYVTL